MLLQLEEQEKLGLNCILDVHLDGNVLHITVPKKDVESTVFVVLSVKKTIKLLKTMNQIGKKYNSGLKLSNDDVVQIGESAVMLWHLQKRFRPYSKMYVTIHADE